MNHLIESKLIHYKINADYSIPNLSIDNQTNLLITKVMNEFCNQFGTFFTTDKIFVFYNNDDLISLISYCILCNIRGITDFKFQIYNKPKKLKNHFNKTERYITNKELKKNKDKIFIIHSKNPIYTIINKEPKPMGEYLGISLFKNKPTPAELFCLQIFYGASYHDNTINPSNLEIEALNNWFKEPFSHVVPPALKEFVDTNVPIYMCWLKDDDDYNTNILQEVEQSDAIALYFYEGEMPLILSDKTYNFLLKRRTNVPAAQYGNLNNEELADLFIDNKFEIKWLGDWPLA